MILEICKDDTNMNVTYLTAKKGMTFNLYEEISSVIKQEFKFKNYTVSSSSIEDVNFGGENRRKCCLVFKKVRTVY